VSEEVFDLTLVPIRRVFVADGFREAQSARERLDRARVGVLIPESRLLLSLVVERTPESQQLQRFGREVPQTKEPQRFCRQVRQPG
jgi:hypothetical protein